MIFWVGFLTLSEPLFGLGGKKAALAPFAAVEDLVAAALPFAAAAADLVDGAVVEDEVFLAGAGEVAEDGVLLAGAGVVAEDGVLLAGAGAVAVDAALLAGAGAVAASGG